MENFLCREPDHAAHEPTLCMSSLPENFHKAFQRQRPHSNTYRHLTFLVQILWLKVLSARKPWSTREKACLSNQCADWHIAGLKRFHLKNVSAFRNKDKSVCQSGYSMINLFKQESMYISNVNAHIAPILVVPKHIIVGNLLFQWKSIQKYILL